MGFWPLTWAHGLDRKLCGEVVVRTTKVKRGEEDQKKSKTKTRGLLSKRERKVLIGTKSKSQGRLKPLLIGQ
jgi:hypothetical protein